MSREDLDSNSVNEDQEGSSFLGMSDDEIASLDLSALSQPVEQEASDEPGEVATEDGDVETDDSTDLEEGDGDESDEDVTDDVEATEKPEGTEEVDEDDKDPKEEASESEGDLDYKTEYENLFAPFKANGKEMKVDSVEDARTLMQMGANYNKKMAALKPNLKVLKMLENNSLLDEQKLSYLIDLDKKNPAAIAKLIKESGIDPLDIDTDAQSDYQPETYSVDDREIELDTVLDELKDTPTYNQTINEISNKWDGASKQIVANNPQLLRVINDHVASGVYDVISKEVEKQRVFGRLNGLSELEAYRQVGDQLQAQGGFDHLFQAQPSTEKRVVTPKPARKAADPQLKSKKRAASPAKATSTAKAEPDFNPLALSDDEFLKQVNEKFL